MAIFYRMSFISLFDRKRSPSAAPSNIKTFGGLSFGIGWPLGPRPRALPRQEQFTAASLTRVRTAACLITTIMLGCVSCSFVPAAGKSTLTGFAITYDRWVTYVAEASSRFGVPAHWIRAVMQVESAGDKGAMSPKGAMGLMQVMPETYTELRLRYHLGPDPYEPRNNILAGAAYLREMRDRYGPAGFLAAYNAGPGRYEDYLTRGRPLPQETHDYVGMLAPMIGVPALPRNGESAPVISRKTASIAAHHYGAQSTAPNKTRFSSKISPFENRQGAQTTTLFAILRAASEPTSVSAQTVDMTALEPSSNRALRATSPSEVRQSDSISKAAQSSLTPSGNALFAGRSALAAK